MQQTRQDGVEAANMLIILRSRWMPQLPQSYSLYSCPTFNALVTRSITSLGNIQYVYVNIYTEHNTQVKLHYPQTARDHHGSPHRPRLRRGLRAGRPGVLHRGPLSHHQQHRGVSHSYPRRFYIHILKLELQMIKCAFTFKTLLRYYAEQAPKHSK